tara:strand:+ start:1853 stop:2875 length:1023 start_codon:yes stop_codon:yes gene_type:complete
MSSKKEIIAKRKAKRIAARKRKNKLQSLQSLSNIESYISQENLLYNKDLQKTKNLPEGKIAILYSYSPYSKCQNVKIINFYYFLKNGVIPSKDYIYYFIISGNNINSKLEEELNKKQIEVNNKFPNTFNIIKRNNIGFDFGAYSDILFSIDYKSYDYYFFINDSVRGPFLFHWSPEQNWIKIFTSLFDDNTKIVGPTINYYRGKPHINSEFFVLDKIGLDIAIKYNIFSKTYIRKFGQVCQQCEVGISTKILDSGYNIKCLFEAHKGVDFRKHRGNQYANSSLMPNFKRGGEPLRTNMYYNRNINIYEVIFIKANRNIDDYLMDNYTNWSLYGNKEYSNK